MIGQPLDLDAIRAYVEAATPGTWAPARELDGWRVGRLTVVKAGGRRVFTVDQTRPHHDDRAEANVEFAVRAHADMPKLIARVDGVERENDRLWAMVGRLHGIAEAAKRAGVTLDPAEVLSAVEGVAAKETAA